MILSKLGIRVKRDEGEALKKGVDEVRQLFMDMTKPGTDKGSTGSKK